MADHALQLAVSLLKVFWLLLPATVLVRLFRSRRFKGLLGELRVNRAIRQHLDRHAYHAFRNLTLPTTDGTTQIDHVLVSPFGIFVIETKNMQGLISGGTRDRLWTQQLGTHVRSFQNPLHQNYKHTKTLHELTGISEAHIFSLVVFVGSGELVSVMPENVAQGKDFIRLIKARRKQLFNAAQTEAAIRAIKAASIRNSFSARRRHIQHVRSLVAAKQSGPQICPLCGSPMVLRTAKKGRNAGENFWGCSEFPYCVGTRNA